MYRTHTCGQLRIENVGQSVTLAGWVQKSRKLGGMTFIDLRDRYGITQLVVEADAEASLIETATSLGREYVIQVTGEVIERESKNSKMATGDIENNRISYYVDAYSNLARYYDANGDEAALANAREELTKYKALQGDK